MNGLMRRFIFLWMLQWCPSVSKKQIFGLREQDAATPHAMPTPEFLAASPARQPYQDVVYDSNLAQSHLVRDLPGIPFGYSHAMYAGDVSIYEPVMHNNGSLFYWLFESQHKPEEDPLVIWINGGPGCSGMEGVLIEHGPFLAVASGFDLDMNAYSWNRNANMLYLDQPVGTGYGAAPDGVYAKSQKEVNIMFMTFLKRWMNVFPQYRNRPLYLAGESYAGRYIPSFAKEVLAAGGFNLQGIAIGNGWTHPMTQSEILPAYSFNLGLISAEQKEIMDDMVSKCRAKWDADPYSTETYDTCEPVQQYAIKNSGTSQVGKVNQFDIRSYDTNAGGEWPWRKTGEVSYLNRPDVRKALHVTTALKWVECSPEVEKYLTHEDMYPTVQELQDVLSGIRVLLYNGQFDYICNHVGVETFINGMDFRGKEQFVDPSRKGLWVTSSRTSGYVKQGGNLTFLVVLGGSHMVPMDKRPETFDMMMRFLNDRSFADLANSGHNGKPEITGPKDKYGKFEMLAAVEPVTQSRIVQSASETSTLTVDNQSWSPSVKLSKFDSSGMALLSLGVMLGLSVPPLAKRLRMGLSTWHEKRTGTANGYHLVAS